MKTPYSDRNIYRETAGKKNLYSFQISVKETDLHIQTSVRGLEKKAEKKILQLRSVIENHIKKNPEFKTSLKPILQTENTDPVIEKMIKAGINAGVGPMASVAGGISQELTDYLSKFSEEVIIENGGDIFIKTHKTFTAGIYAGENSPFSNKIGIKINPHKGMGICTSSGTFGHSLSFGAADAVCVLSKSAYIADAFATALCNMVKKKDDLEKTLKFAEKQNLISGVIIIYRDKIGALGDLELVRL